MHRFTIASIVCYCSVRMLEVLKNRSTFSDLFGFTTGKHRKPQNLRFLRLAGWRQVLFWRSGPVVTIVGLRWVPVKAKERRSL